MKKQQILCSWHLCNVYIFALPNEAGGSDIIDTVCPICWLEETFQGAAVTDMICNENNALVGLVFDNHQALYLNQPHGIDQDGFHFQYHDQDTLFTDITAAFLKSVHYVPGDELAGPMLKIEFASMTSCRRTNWSLVEVPEIEKQIRERLLDEHIPN
ncbi:MAG: hypothetical protein RBT34_08795 [Anaerolineaceae bacterium]|jgi:hypothetical protein|nr:hypothetical protein [Anaerolineaceae bacterium]MDY0280577.1 hypothetical protein [Salinivirgaceae bacterium]